MFSTAADVCDWLAERRAINDYRVKEVPLDQLDGWRIRDNGDIGHRTGRFYTVTGLEVTGADRPVGSWQQPIIDQPEIGILGIVVKRFNGAPHCLLQAKMEPGNVNMLQLSPTVQATRSNYTRAHGGKPVPYLDYFLAPRRDSVLFDALQSEQGAWFLAKRNRNMIVEVTGDVPVLPDFCWVRMDDLGELLRIDNLVNMDTRTVLSGAASLRQVSGEAAQRPRHTVAELLSWFTEAKARSSMKRRRIPLAEVSGWAHEHGMIKHHQDRHFAVLGLEVLASNREVTGWSQPMIAPRGYGVVAFLSKRVRGTPHLLIQARMEAGAFDAIEMAPTVQCIPDNYRDLPAGQRPHFLDEVLSAPESRIRFDCVHSEEGGRFYHAQNRYMLVELPEDAPEPDLPENFVWMTPRQLMGFVRYGNHLNVEARSLVACLGLSADSPALQGRSVA
ncbi:NDP-hexose 2,3-dehydratase family protein [Kibdelosporangium persicum]|uniref:Oxidase EvaA n=1 Tax=Kibdelosporangium persicum TaxID=2698649 RepID=A0ABX2EWY4_9PSEU|nr:NDP-hexose 2,3-dehydratase family protein [Kibdelosporangium persicum]NRN63208.1 Oxidase EvaA [Kibdelosporangium persicum]